jgi:hypothetical protein
MTSMVWLVERAMAGEAQQSLRKKMNAAPNQLPIRRMGEHESPQLRARTIPVPLCLKAGTRDDRCEARPLSHPLCETGFHRTRNKAHMRKPAVAGAYGHSLRDPAFGRSA